MLFGWALRETTGNDEGLLSSPQVKNATAYLAVNFGGDDRMIPFNDTQPWILGWPVLAAAGTEADSPLARWMADHIAADYAAGSPAPEQSRSTYPRATSRNQRSPSVFASTKPESVCRPWGQQRIEFLRGGQRPPGCGRHFNFWKPRQFAQMPGLDRLLEAVARRDDIELDGARRGGPEGLAVDLELSRQPLSDERGCD